MSPYRRMKSFIVGLAVLMAYTDAKGVAVPAEDNYTDEIAIVREPSFESDITSEDQQENMVTRPAMVYYLQQARNHHRLPTDLFRKGSQPRSPLTSWPLSALMYEMSDETSGKLSGRQSSSPLARAVAMIRRKAAALAAGFNDETPFDCVGDLGRRPDHSCRSLHANPDDELEQKAKRREFVVDLGKRFHNFRSDLGKRFFNGRQKIH